MNNQGLLALAQLILPSEILINFEVVHVEEEASKSGKTKCARFEKRNVQKSGKTKRPKKIAHTTL